MSTKETEAFDPLAKLREPFPSNQISKLPKETGAQAEQRKADIKAGNWPKKCDICGGLHHPRAVHLDYVGHAAATDRLLDADPRWTWEPMAVTPEGLPAFDRNGGLWIKMTVDGVTRIGYGAADGKTGGDAIKEIIGDAIRNAGIRFGMALDLWHKGDLHAHLEDDAAPPAPKACDVAIQQLIGAVSADDFKATWAKIKAGASSVMTKAEYARVIEVMQREATKWAPPKADPEPPHQAASAFDIPANEIPY